MDKTSAWKEIEAAAADGRLSAGAVTNLKIWLTEPRYAQYAPQVIAHVAGHKWKELDDAFWTVIPFGTGGRRGKMYPIGSNTINERTIGESAQGLADYVRDNVAAPHACAIAYDTRHRSREFAELCAEVMVAAGFKVFFLDGYRSTPELSFTVRFKQCSCGIMVTASHNPPSDNAVKAYWSTGGQLLPPHDKGVIERVMSVGDIRHAAFAEALADGKIILCQDEVNRAFVEAVVTNSFPGPRDVKIVYSPLHGVGASAVSPVLAADGFDEVELFGPHVEPNGDFPNVPGHVSNPENHEVFTAIIDAAITAGADLVLATDPDCDRIGCAAPLLPAVSSPWAAFTGNQIAALLAEYVLERRKELGQLSPQHYLVKTLVTTEMVRRIGDQYGVKTFGDLMVGFKWIGGVIDDEGPELFVLGAEESLGFLVGSYARDKDASAAAMLLAELAARLKASGKTLHEQLDALYWQYGCHVERVFSLTMPGAEGMDRMQQLMARFRQDPPRTLGGLKVARIRDYLNLTTTVPGQASQPLEGQKGDMVVLDLEYSGTYIAVRPSGTEPKVKFYMFAFEPPEMLASLEAAKQELATRLEDVSRDLMTLAGV